MHKNKLLRICYFGISSPDFSRNRVYLAALKRQGVQVHECFAPPQGIRKFILLFKEHWLLRGKYDVLVVAYPGHRIVWFARLLTRKPIVFDALCTLWEAETLSHEAAAVKQAWIRFIDWLAVRLADVILVESESQKKFFMDRFGGSSAKYEVVYTGVDETVFFFDASVKKLPHCTVVFRGRLSHESGIDHVVRAAKILEGKDIFFRIVGYGYNLSLIRKIIRELNIKNIEVIHEQLPFVELKEKMAECHVSIGQLGASERLSRTIPHKAFESLALKLPYITAKAEAISEILEDGVSCVMIPVADPVALADAIISLRNNPTYADSLAESAHRVFDEKLSQRALGAKLKSILVMRAYNICPRES